MRFPRAAATTRGVRPRLLMVIAEDWYFWSHRLHIAQAAQRAGYDVGLATAQGDQ